jgi:ABC-type nitrate/sulfonate/bicarbonate transport system substrate-binding protein
MTPVRVVLEYFHPWPNDAGLHTALAGGHYREAGLDIELAVADPLRGDPLAYLARGEADFVVCPTNRLLVRRERGERLTGIAAINHRAMETVQTVTDTAITRPRQLEGRRVAYNPTPRGVAMVRHLVRSDGGDPDSVVTVDSGVRELSVDDIAAGEVDATFGGYWAWDALFGSLEPERRVVWPVDEIGGLRYHSYLLATRDALIEESPELVRGFLEASAAGYLAASADEEATLALLERVIPYFPREILRRSLELIVPTWTHAGRWGEQRSELLGDYARWLADNQVIGSPGIWREAISNALLPGLVA